MTKELQCANVPKEGAFYIRLDKPSFDCRTQVKNLKNLSTTMKISTDFKRILFTCAIFVSCTSSMQAEVKPLRERLAQRLPDIERVDHIVGEYNTLRSKVELDDTTTKAIEDWLCTKCLFLGSKFYDHSLLYHKLPSRKSNSTFERKFKKFSDNITFDDYAGLPKEAAETAKKITILFTGAYGGGHKAPAIALNNYLTEKGYAVQFIDVDEVENRYSPQINGYTKADIYAEVYQKQNDPEKAQKLTRMLNKAQKIEDKKFLGDIRNSVKEFQPDHIFAVAHHKPKLAYISYSLGVPMTYVHTDHGFNNMLLPILYEQERLEHPLIQFGMLAQDQYYGAVESIVRQLVRLDFPVRASFKPISRKARHKLRDALNIPRNAYVVKLAMGQNGLAKDMTNILSRMKKEQKKLKRQLHVFAVCGKNEMLKNALEKFARGKGKVRVHILGFLDEKEMAAVDRASDLWITKPGGSTSAELVQTQKQMLYEINKTHPWEQNNADYLESLGLAKKLSKKTSIIRQIQSRIKKHSFINTKNLPLSQWQSQVDSIIGE